MVCGPSDGAESCVKLGPLVGPLVALMALPREVKLRAAAIAVELNSVCEAYEQMITIAPEPRVRAILQASRVACLAAVVGFRAIEADPVDPDFANDPPFVLPSFTTDPNLPAPYALWFGAMEMLVASLDVIPPTLDKLNGALQANPPACDWARHHAQMIDAWWQAALGQCAAENLYRSAWRSRDLLKNAVHPWDWYAQHLVHFRSDPVPGWDDMRATVIDCGDTATGMADAVAGICQ